MSQNSQMTIAELNDRFRQQNLGFGQVVVSPMVEMMPTEQLQVLLALVRNFNDFNESEDPCLNGFNENNDPYGERALGAVEFQDKKYLWKIDYYSDDSSEYGPEDPSDTLTRRVLTIMHSSEY
jgi:hypothetical protein